MTLNNFFDLHYRWLNAWGETPTPPQMILLGFFNLNYLKTAALLNFDIMMNMDDTELFYLNDLLTSIYKK